MSTALVLLFVFSNISTCMVISHDYYIYINESSPDAVNDTFNCGNVSAPCQSFDLGLDVAQYLLRNLAPSSITLLLAKGDYEHNSDTNGIFNNVSKLSIIGQTNEEEDKTFVFCNVSGFSFTNSDNIKIFGIAFIGCGQLQNSTSYYDNSKSVFLKFYVGLYFLYCRNVTLKLIAVSNSTATGIVLYNTIGNNIIDNIRVTNNKYNKSMSGGGTGLYIEYSYCVPNDDETGIECLQKMDSPNTNHKYTTGGNFFIINSIFEENVANITDFNDNTFILPRKQYHLAFGRGGGLSVFFKGNASNNSIIIDDCVFKNNQAVWGGGIYTEFQDTSHYNLLSVNSTVLEGNSLYYSDVRNEGTGGGGARVDYVYFDTFSSYGNNIIFTNCNFTNNTAYYGGAISFYSAVQLTNLTSLNSFELHGCSFSSNVGRIGAAVDISLWESFINGKPPAATISDCTFAGNNPIRKANRKGLIGIGTVCTDSIPVSFDGVVTFTDNSGSALVVTGSYISIGTNAYVKFCGNSGRNGGAIALYGNTFILTYHNSTLVFINNTAQYKGGAIYFYSSGQRDLLSSRSCFIRFIDITVQPRNWTSTFYFENNGIARYMTKHIQPNSIYASSLLSCIWGGASGRYSYNISDTEVFCWNKRWIYKDSSSCKTQISSAPTSFRHFNSVFQTLPGKILNVSEVSVYTDTEQDVSEDSILIAQILNSSATFCGTENAKFDYISHRHLDICGEPNSNITIQLETLDPIVVQDNIFVYLSDCPPGFYPPSTDNKNDNFSCACREYAPYNGYIQCHNSDSTSRIFRTIWFGLYNEESVVGACPFLQPNSTYKRYVTLMNGSEDYLNSIFCGSIGREEILCGSCTSGTGVALASYSCVKCPSYSWLYYLLAVYFPITVFFALVFIFSMTVTFGPLNSFLFFSQVITTTVKIDADGMIPLQNFFNNTVLYSVLQEFYIIPYDVWNMNFFQNFLSNFCLNTEMNTLDVMLLRYLEAFYPLILLLVIIPLMVMYSKGVMFVVRVFRPLHYCLARFRQWTNLRQSVTGGIAVFVIISYTKFTFISLLLLTPAALYNYKGNIIEIVHYFDGNIQYPSYKYAVPAYVILFSFGIVPPVLLIYPSLLKTLERISCSKLKLTKLYPPLTLKIFLDEFHGCYKDGSNKTMDCRWVAGLYFILRIALFVIYTTVSTWEVQYVIQILIFVLMVFLFAIIRPYKDDWINIVDITIFLILIVISLLSLYSLMQTWIDQDISICALIIQYILIFLPLVYCLGYYFALFCTKNTLPCVKSWLGRKSTIIQVKNQQEDNFGYQNALVDSTHVPNILEYIDARTSINEESMSNFVNLQPKVDETSPLLVDRT